MSKDSLSISRKTSKVSINLAGIAGSIFSTGSIFFGAQFLAVVFIGITLGTLGNNPNNIEGIFSDNRLVQLGLVSLVAIISAAVIIRLLMFLNEKPQKFLMLNKRPTAGQLGEVVLIYGLYFLVLVVVSIVLSIFTGVNIEQVQELGITRPDSISGKLVIFVILAVMPPIYEELLFRGYLFNMLRKYSSQIAAIVITSLLFGAAHLEYSNLNWIAAIDTLIFSCFLIYVSQKHQSLYSAMLLHAIKNSIAFYVLFVR